MSPEDVSTINLNNNKKKNLREGGKEQNMIIFLFEKEKLKNKRKVTEN